ncbi:MAG: hypothetical protein NXI24_01210 [bacterium]|nr:hypothetical protein [bacterium]
MAGLELLKDTDAQFSHAPASSAGADRLARMSPDELAQIVQASIDGWAVFIETGLSSEYYREARERVGSERAARVTLMHLYLSTFARSERVRLETDVDYFLEYATGFLRELFLPLPSADEARRDFRRSSRLIFIRAMRRIFRTSLSETRRCRQSDPHVFMRNMIRMCASVSGIVEIWDDYKEYMYRFYPQMHSLEST